MKLHRRSFLKQSSSLSAALAFSSFAAAENNFVPTADRLVEGKDPRLAVLDGALPVLETPTELLYEPITPTSLVFVRNNQSLSDSFTIAPVAARGWRIHFSGLINGEHSIDAANLAELPQVEQVMVLQCSGNGRSLFSQAAQTKGTQWTRGGMANVSFSGPKLASLLESLKIDISSKAEFITAEGKDGPVGEAEDFEHSLPLQETVSQAIIATEMNGKPLPAVHGGPVRLVIPGVFGTMQIKWLHRLRFEAEETTNHNHIPRYRTPKAAIAPGAEITYTLANSNYNWRMKVKSVVLSPAPESTVKAGKVSVQGVAFNDGAARLESVLISLDRGESWKQTKITVSKHPYGWSLWSYELQAKPGRLSLWSRAVDAHGRSQPLEGSVAWNPSGYEWNGVEKIDLSVV